MQKYTFIVVGGGIAGVSCVENLAAESPNDSILLLSASPIVKSVINLKQLTRNLEKFDVLEKQCSTLQDEYPNVTVLQEFVCHFESDKKLVRTTEGHTFMYEKLCICTGASPKLISKTNPNIIGIRDTETVLEFEARLQNAKKIVVVGNGGIATELVFNVKSCEVVWVVKDSSITTTFMDPAAAKFLLPQIMGGAGDGGGCGEELGVKQDGEVYVKRNKFILEGGFKGGGAKSSLGCAMGPDWLDILNATGNNTIHMEGDRSVHVEYNIEVIEFLTPQQVQDKKLTCTITGKQEYVGRQTQTDTQQDKQCHAEAWPIYVRLSGDKLIGCDFVVSATGVQPNVHPFAKTSTKLKLSQSDGGIEVDSCMMTSVPEVFAAGDVCTATWQLSPYWLQMRLWSQARQMGVQASRAMMADLQGAMAGVQLDFCFELFAHVTNFFNYKVILLGKFNGQGHGNDHQLMIKVVEGEKYIKIVLKEGRMVGAILIGETDLEETFENLILNGLDLSCYGEDLLDQDLEDFFD